MKEALVESKEEETEQARLEILERDLLQQT